MNTISLNGRQPLRQVGLDGNSILGDCASRQHNHLIDRLIEIKTSVRPFNAPAAKHVARPAFPDEADRRGEKSQR